MGRVAGGSFSKQEVDFARALSLTTMRGQPVSLKDAKRLAVELLAMDGGFRGALDAEAAGPADRIVEDALEEFEKFLATVLSGDNLRRAQELALGLTTAAQRAEELRRTDAADGRRRAKDEAEQRGAADRRRQAHDARPSVLDGVLAGVRKPMRV